MKIAVDTNILVRAVLQDDEDQGSADESAIGRPLAAHEVGPADDDGRNGQQLIGRAKAVVRRA